MSKQTSVEQHPTVLLKTNFGDITLELFPEKAPITVENFLQYVKDGQYDHTIFHRVMSNFMIQGGGFKTDMQQKTEGLRAPIKNEASNGLSNVRGSIAMARTNDINSATAQFFINVVDNKGLDYTSPTSSGFGYCVFGKVIAGMDTVDKIKAVKTGNKGMHQNVPLEIVEIIEAKKL